MKKLPLGIQNFRKIIEGDYIYVDKTEHIYNLLNSASYYFLSRPRRFGKSLLLDTIGEVFKGEKELFKGLWIYDSDYDFEKHPVIRLDMSNISNETPDILKKSIIAELKKRIAEEGLKISCEIPSDMFKSLIEGLHKKYGQRVVVLIDEYDKPILDHITDVSTAEANRAVLSGFYGVLKSMDPYLRFTFITGVSKFAKTSIFSGLNNLLDITMDESSANICGIEVESLLEYFGEYIDSLATLKNFKHYESVHREILEWYDGYSWDGETKLINPFSLLSFFRQKRFESFWYASGTPRFLIEIIKEKPESFLALKGLEIRERVLDAFDISRIEVEPLLFQTGYLTVKEVRYESGPNVYLLEMPNREVREAFSLQIIAELTEKGETFTETAYRRIYKSLNEGDLSGVLDVLRSLFSSIPYGLHVNVEAYYHSIFFAVMTVLGFDIDAEVSVSKGRVDAVLELSDKVYVFEFKYGKSAQEGIAQIKSRGYHKKYEGKGKEIILAAFAFLGRDDIEMCVEKLPG